MGASRPSARPTRKPRLPLATDVPAPAASGAATELIGPDRTAATRLFGAATEQLEQPPPVIWRYKNAGCELDLFFCLDLRSHQMRTLHYALNGNGGDTSRRQDCLKSLSAARSS